MNAPLPPTRQTSAVWLAMCMLGVFLLTATLEVQRLLTAISEGLSPLAAVSFWDFETTLPLLLLAVLPLLLLAVRPPASPRDPAQPRSLSPWAAVLIAGVALLASLSIGRTRIPLPAGGPDADIAFQKLPFAYHDEYSYLLQAETFAAGRLSYPPCEQFPDLFHQIHVRNQPRTVSRYFPTTGAFVALFLGTGQPITGHWLAGALAACLFAACLAMVASPRTAVCGGLLLAVSPGLAVFSNLLLAHHPTMLCLSVFTWACLHLKRQPDSLAWATLAGTALTLAMLGRPMTAAGFALPFGVDLLITLIRVPASRKTVAGFAIPLAVGFATLAWLNHDATGDPLSSAYQSYTDEFTPRHRFGFDNAVDTPPSQGPPALQKYDNWATNLTPTGALENAGRRLMASFQWTLARVPLLLGILLVLPVIARPTGPAAVRPLESHPSENHPSRNDPSNSHSPTCQPLTSRWLATLLLSSIVCLHLVHLPYWFDGILHWHYVFETAPPLIMLATLGWSAAAARLSDRLGNVGVLWVVLFLVAGLVPGWIRLPMYQNTSKVSAAISEQAFSRTRMHYFQTLIHADTVRRPALILVDESQSDPQLSYIINPPDYHSDVLVCRLPQTSERTAEVRAAFAQRACYVFDPPSLTLRPLNAD